MSRCLKVVIADDERDTREYLEEYLAHLGHEVMAAEDGWRLVALCREFKPDLIVTDYAMPGLDGLAAAEEVNRERPAPVILISGRHDAQEAVLGSANIVRILLKPVKDADLKAAVDSVAALAAVAGD